MGNKKVISYVQYALKLKLKSPLCISGGVKDVTDSDVQKDYDGKPFIPGTSFAGALRGYLEECLDERVNENISKVFGFGRGPEGTMSRVQISDLYFEDNGELIIRDRIKLENKLTVDGAKFDMEAVDTGAVCYGFLLLTIREDDDRDGMEKMVEQALAGLNCGEIRLGANKNRGFGEITVLTVKKKSFSKAEGNIGEWLDFDRKVLLEQNGNDILEKLERPESRYLTIRVPLKQKGGISIRSYSVVPNEPDYAHITSNGSPVIPGNSWNGAIRNRVEEILGQLGLESYQKYIDNWFGYVKDSDAMQSNIVISESVIEGGVDLSMTRTKINRYDASAIPGALYSEKSYFNGSLELEIKVRKNYYAGNDVRYEPMVGMLLIALKDLQNGYLAVGGQTAIGRGIFEAAGSIKLEGTEKNENDYIKAVSALFEKEQRG